MIHITRQKDLFHQDEANEITLEEWMSFVAKDPDMRLDNYTTVTLQFGEKYRYENPGAAVIFNRAPGQLNAREVAAEFIGGNIVIKGSAAHLMNKVRQIAFKLNAQIFIESKSFTQQLEVDAPEMKPRFRFTDVFNPIRKSIPQVGQLFRQLAFSFMKSGQPKS
jgi:hypothetical protein